MRVVVVGATGNAGTSVVSALAADGAVESIVGLARRPRGPAHPKVRWERADVRLTDLTLLRREWSAAKGLSAAPEGFEGVETAV